MNALLNFWNTPARYNGWGVLGVAAMGHSAAYAAMGRYGIAAVFALLWLLLLIGINAITV